jgi:hypothetical protein
MTVEFSGIENLTIANNWRPSKVKGSDGKEYSCFKSHTSSNNDKPVTGSMAEAYWVETAEDCSTSPNWQEGVSYDGDYINSRIPLAGFHTSNC